MSEKSENRIAHLKSISLGASLHTVGFGLGKGFQFLTQLVLTRSLGPALYGIYSYAMTLVLVLRTLSRFGTGKSLLKLIPRYDKSQHDQSWVLGLSFITGAIGSAIISVVVFVSAPVINSHTLGQNSLVDVLRIFAIYIPFLTISDLIVQVFRSYQKPKLQTAIDNVLNPGIRLVSLMIAVSLGFSIIGISYATVSAGVIVSVVSIFIFLQDIGVQPKPPNEIKKVKEFYGVSIPLTFKDLGQILYSRSDILMIGFFISGTGVGIYRVAISLTSFISMPLIAFNQLFPPIASNLYKSGKIEELEEIYADVTLIIYTVSILPSVLLIIYSPEVLSIFGSDFTSGANVVALLISAQLFNVGVGPCAYVLLMADYEKIIMVNQWILGGLNLILNYIFIQEFGLIGAALATAIVLAGINSLRMVELYLLEAIHPYSKKYWKPTAAAAVSAIVALSLRGMLSGYVLMTVGGILGTVSFVIVMWFLDVSEEIDTLQELIS